MQCPSLYAILSIKPHAFFVCVAFLQLRRGIARIQAAYKAQRLATQFNVLRDRIVILQSYCRGYVTRVKLGQRRRAVVTLQSGWRRVLAKKKAEELRREVCREC